MSPFINVVFSCPGLVKVTFNSKAFKLRSNCVQCILLKKYNLRAEPWSSSSNKHYCPDMTGENIYKRGIYR